LSEVEDLLEITLSVGLGVGGFLSEEGVLLGVDATLSLVFGEGAISAVVGGGGGLVVEGVENGLVHSVLDQFLRSDILALSHAVPGETVELVEVLQLLNEVVGEWLLGVAAIATVNDVEGFDGDRLVEEIVRGLFAALIAGENLWELAVLDVVRGVVLASLEFEVLEMMLGERLLNDSF
jgi:hypothetical protein